MLRSEEGAPARGVSINAGRPVLIVVVSESRMHTTFWGEKGKGGGLTRK